MTKHIGKISPDVTEELDNPYPYTPVVYPENDEPVYPKDDEPDIYPKDDDPIVYPDYDEPVYPKNDPNVYPNDDITNIYDTVFNPEIKNYPIFIKCTWVRAFTEPVVKKNLGIISYNRTAVNSSFKQLKNKTGVQDGQVATCTGNTFTDSKKGLWIEGNLFYCNRRSTGWFRVTDVNVVIIETTGPGVNLDPAKKNSWVAWLTAGLTALSLLK